MPSSVTPPCEQSAVTQTWFENVVRPARAWAPPAPSANGAASATAATAAPATMVRFVFEKVFRMALAMFTACLLLWCEENRRQRGPSPSRLAHALLTDRDSRFAIAGSRFGESASVVIDNRQ